MSYSDMHDYQPEIRADLAALQPLGDLVLVKPFPPEDLIIDPGVKMTRDGRWMHNRPKGAQLGTVVAVGKGDLMVSLQCESACYFTQRILRSDQSIKRGKCPKCGGELKTCGWDFLMKPKTEHPLKYKAMTARAEMHVKPGDLVVFPRVPANEIEINGEDLVFLHEESQVLAVIEQETA